MKRKKKKNLAFTNTRVNQCDCGEVVISEYFLKRPIKGLKNNYVFRMDFNFCKCGILWILNGTFGVKIIK